jgi:thiol-disulfide isomerase/thioredoxin
LRRPLILTVVIAVVCAVAGVLVYQWHAGNLSGAAVSREGAQRLFAAQFPGTDGKLQPVSQWRGRVLIVNFWATWCDPCREEIPTFIKLQTQYRDRGVVFVGIAVDHRDKVESYAREIGMNYPVVIGGLDSMDMARQLGNTKSVLPFTVLVDRNGNIALSQFGAISATRLEGAIEKLI